jgi:hypothetical protein
MAIVMWCQPITDNPCHLQGNPFIPKPVLIFLCCINEDTRRNSLPPPTQLAATCPRILYYQHLPAYFCAALIVMQAFKTKIVWT